jgi:outer membrane protein OmpA-like peptidoglycan-associated protein
LGAQGTQGDTGLAGSQPIATEGIAGPAGPQGAAGDKGQTGSTGEQGVAGIVADWTSYKVFQFSGKNAAMSTSDMKQVSEIADYMKKNPSLHVGIDGYMNPRDRDLSNLRVNTVRYSLAKAGMPDDKIEIGAFGDANLRRDGRVEVLFRTDN